MQVLKRMEYQQAKKMYLLLKSTLDFKTPLNTFIITLFTLSLQKYHVGM